MPPSPSSPSSQPQPPRTPPLPTTPHTITTPRLRLRTPTKADLPALHEYFTNPAATGTDADPNLTLDALAARLEKWNRTREEGGNAWLLVCLRGAQNDEEGEGEGEERVIGFGGYNSFPRTKMLNSSERKSDRVEQGETVRVGDIGVGIDAREQRKGYAREALCGMIEYAFTTLHCGYMHLDTQPANTAFRALMRDDLGLPEQQGCGEEHADAVFRFAWKSLNYDFDGGMWARAREALERRGKWPL